jgi:8-oxo-dGTP pyrophosphatase MutT (NUDIX family)
MTKKESKVAASSPKARRAAAAIVFDTSGRLILQQRDDIPNILNPGKIGLFGGHLEGDETFLECVVREIHEELGYYVPPERFERIGGRIGPDIDVPGAIFHGEVFLTREVPVDKLKVTEGTLKIVTIDELDGIEHALTSSARLALQFFLGRELKGPT